MEGEFTTRPVIMGSHGMVSSGHYLASSLAFGILERGGNAIDAGVTAVFALTLLKPYECGIAGECPILIYRSDTPERAPNPAAISGQGTAPRQATLSWFRERGFDAIPGRGLLAATVPATFGALVEALKRFGSLRLADTLGPVVDLARSGYPLYPAFRTWLVDYEATFRDEWPTTGAVYLPDGTVPAIGTFMKNEAWARTFERVLSAEAAHRLQGREACLDAALDEFYRGRIAREVAAFASTTPCADEEGRSYPGLLDADDMASYASRTETPVNAAYRGLDVFKCPPWSQGPVFLQQLRLLEGYDLAGMGHNSVEYLHTLVEAAKIAFADREAFYGDPLFSSVPLERLLSPAYAARRRAEINPEAASTALPASGHMPPEVSGSSAGPGGDTTHIDAADAAGNLFSATPSGAWIESSPVIPELGFPLGTRAQLFNLVTGHPNALAPGKRPRTTLTPTLVLRNGAPYLAFGTEGGDNQDQWSLQFFLNVVDFGMDLQAAIDAPLVHSTHFPGSFFPHEMDPMGVVVEGRLPASVRHGMSALGHKVTVAGDWSSGHVTAVRYGQQPGLIEAAASPRTMTAYAIGR